MKVYIVETTEPVDQRFECGIAGELTLYSDRADAEIGAAGYNLECGPMYHERAWVTEIEVEPKGCNRERTKDAAGKKQGKKR